MEFTKEDFSVKFTSQFSDEELKILMDFCRCYNEKFGKYTSKDQIIDQMEKLGPFTHINDPNTRAMATHFLAYSGNGTKIDNLYIEINDSHWDNATIEEKKAVVYHELMHHFSTKEIEGRKIQRGLMQVDDKGTSYFDEIMTEYYATELLRIDNIDLNKSYYTYKSNNTKLDRSVEQISSNGLGYVLIAKLGAVYDRILGKRLFEGKTEDYDNFEQKFNERFQSLGENPLKIINEQLENAFTKHTRESIYECYQTALEVFNIDRNAIYERKGFDLYDYLVRSNAMLRNMPTRDIGEFRMDKEMGIPEELFRTLLDIDKNMIIKYIRPDILQIKDEDERNREINKLSSVINILRENIGSLSQEDIEQITYGEVKEYTHNGLDCLVIKAGDKAFQTFVNNSTELNHQFMPYCSFKAPEEYDKLFETGTDQQMRQIFGESGQQLEDGYTMSMVMNVGGEYPTYGLVESNGKFYTTSGELKEVQISNERALSSTNRVKENSTQQPKKAENKPKDKKLTPEQIQRKMQWVKDFIKDYEDSESSSAYALRSNCEEQNIQTILQSVKTGTFSEAYDNNAQDYGNEISRIMPAMARLLKEADNLTIDGGEDFLTQFANIPQINTILLRIKKSDEYEQMHNNAENNRANNTLPHYKKTEAELDKIYAQDYLRSGNISQPTLEEELAYRESAIRGATERVVDFDAKNETEIPTDRRQKAAVERIIARQQGKVPSKIIESNGVLVFVVDTQREQQIGNSSVTPQNIVASTLRKNTTENEINNVAGEIKRTKTRDLQQLQEK